MGDHATAAGIYETLSMETNQLEQRIEQIPTINTELTDTIPGQLDELQNAYNKMAAEGFKFETNIEKQLANIAEQRQAALELLQELTLKKATEEIAKMKAQTELLYETFDEEAKAAQIVWENNEKLTSYVAQNKRQNHELYARLDRLNQDFVFSKDELGQIRSWEIQLGNNTVNFEELRQHISRHEAVFSTLISQQEAMFTDLERIAKEQTTMWQAFQELPMVLEQSKKRVTLLADKLRLIQRSFERQGLPGLPDTYLSIFYSVSDELERVKQQLGFSRVNMDDVLRQLSIVTADLDTLQERTDSLIEAATITERLVRKALMYRDNPAVAQSTQQARYFYETSYDYEQSMKTLAVILDQIEPGLTNRVVQQYRQEQATLQAEYLEQE
jgi:septation ring formation regulator